MKRRTRHVNLACLIYKKAGEYNFQPLKFDKFSCFPFTENASYSASWVQKMVLDFGKYRKEKPYNPRETRLIRW